MMTDASIGRARADDAEEIPGGLNGFFERIAGGPRSRSGDPLPIVARAMAVVLAVSLSSLTLSAALA